MKYLSGSKIQGNQKKYSENFVDYFPPTKNAMTESESTQKIFHVIVVHNRHRKNWYTEFVVKSPVY